VKAVGPLPSGETGFERKDFAVMGDRRFHHLTPGDAGLMRRGSFRRERIGPMRRSRLRRSRSSGRPSSPPVGTARSPTRAGSPYGDSTCYGRRIQDHAERHTRFAGSASQHADEQVAESRFIERDRGYGRGQSRYESSEVSSTKGELAPANSMAPASAATARATESRPRYGGKADATR